MKIEIVFRPLTPDALELIRNGCKEMNNTFRKDNWLDKMWKSIPKILRDKIPWSTPLEYKNMAILLDSWYIFGIGAGLYQLNLVFNDTTLETYDILKPIFKKIGMETPTRKALEKKVIRDLEEVEPGKEKNVRVIRSKVVY